MLDTDANRLFNGCIDNPFCQVLFSAELSIRTQGSALAPGNQSEQIMSYMSVKCMKEEDGALLRAFIIRRFPFLWNLYGREIVACFVGCQI